MDKLQFLVLITHINAARSGPSHGQQAPKIWRCLEFVLRYARGQTSRQTHLNVRMAMLPTPTLPGAN